MSYRNIVRGSLVLLGVAVGLISTAGGASAEDAAPAPEPAAETTVAEDEATVVTASAQEDDAQIGDGLFIERPAPRPDPANQLRSAPAPATSPAPAPAPAPLPASAPAPAPVVASGGTSAPVVTAAAAAPATVAPARPTEVRGVQIERPAVTSDTAPALARTGSFTDDLAVLAGVLLVLGVLLVRTARPHRAV